MPRLSRHTRSGKAPFRRVLALLALVVMLGVAGCTGPIGSSPPGTTSPPQTPPSAQPSSVSPPPSSDGPASNGPSPTDPTTRPGTDGVGVTQAAIAVRGGSLSVNATTTFERVERVLATNVSPPAAVRVTNATAIYGNTTGTRAATVTSHARFERALGLTHPVNASTLVSPNGVTLGYGTVAIYPGASPTAATTGPLLAHEFVHYVQFTADQAATLRAALDASHTTDGAFVRRAVLEGVAVTAETAYVERYRPNATTGIDRSERALDALPAGSAFAYHQLAYVAGAEYVTARDVHPRAGSARPTNAPGVGKTATAASTSRVYTDPPQTSEQLLHATHDDPLPLDVSVETDGVEYRGGPADRLGEAYLRVALANADPGTTIEPGTPARPVRTDPAAAAAGWGEDSLVVLRRNATTNYVWVLRFDTARDATEAHDALAALLDARGDRSPRGDHWTLPDTRSALHRPTDDTVVLAVGDASFVADLSVRVGEPTDGHCAAGGSDATDADGDAAAAGAGGADGDAAADTSQFRVTLALDGSTATRPTSPNGATCTDA